MKVVVVAAVATTVCLSGPWETVAVCGFAPIVLFVCECVRACVRVGTMATPIR